MMRMARVVLVVAGLSATAVACSSDSKAATKTTTAGTAPEQRRASASDVAAGLKKIQTTSTGIAVATTIDKDKAKELVGRIEPVWKTIEGTVKANDPDAYITFEDNFAVLENAADKGDVGKAAQGAAAVTKAVATYLVKYPG